MAKYEIPRPGHGAYLAWMVPFVVLFGILAYILLITPLYCYVASIAIGFFVYKFLGKFKTSQQDLDDAIFIKGHKKANVCIVGAGFSGLCMGVKLKQAGVTFRILEKGHEIGGTWSANRYPGCRCDVYSILYQVNKTTKPQNLLKYLT
jgi:hypothetical protein